MSLVRERFAYNPVCSVQRPEKLLIRVTPRVPPRERCRGGRLRVGFVDPADWEIIVQKNPRILPAPRLS